MLRFLLVVASAAGSFLDKSVCDDPYITDAHVCVPVREIDSIINNLVQDQPSHDSSVVRLREIVHADPGMDLSDLMRTAADWAHRAQLAMADDTIKFLNVLLEEVGLEISGMALEFQRANAERRMVDDHRARFAELEAIIRSLAVPDAAEEAATQLDSDLLTAIARLAVVPPELVGIAKWDVTDRLNEMLRLGVPDHAVARVMRRGIPQPQFDEAVLAQERGAMMLQASALRGSQQRAQDLLNRISIVAEPLRHRVWESSATVV